MKPGKYTDRYTPDDVRAYRDAGLWSDETMFDLLSAQSEQRPDKVFATDGQRSPDLSRDARLSAATGRRLPRPRLARR